jgi:hypothetical protein
MILAESEERVGPDFDRPVTVRYHLKEWGTAGDKCVYQPNAARSLSYVLRLTG